jgi:hypothetical protein
MSATNPSATPLDRHSSPVRTKGQVPGLAIASFVLGLLGLLLFFIPFVSPLLGLLGLVFGLTARGNSKRGGYEGTWQATAGAILGGLALLVGVGIIIAALAS